MKHSFFWVLTVSAIVFVAVIRGLNFTSPPMPQSGKFPQFQFPTRPEDDEPKKETEDVAAAGRMGEVTVAVRSGGGGGNPALRVVEREETPMLLVQTSRTSTEVYEDAEEGKEDEGAGGLAPFAVGRTDENCDVYSGRWVRDEASRPLYAEEGCPFISSQMRCLAHGRPEKGYQFWRWQPHGCSLPSFNATFMLEKLRGKRMLFVGDSLGASQFFSMACLLHKEKTLKSAKTRNVASLQTLRSEEYNATVEFYWAPFLVKSNCDNSGEHRVTEGDRTIHLYAGALDEHADNWKDADVLIFNTYTWWNTRTAMIKTVSQSNMTRIKVMDTTKAYRMVMKKMVKWVEKNMDPRKTRVFFTSMSPTHWRSQEWGGNPKMNCYGETTPIDNQTYWGSGSSRRIMKVVRDTVGAARDVPIAVVNITQLSEYRKDAHTSIYKELTRNLTSEELRNPRSYADCVHWCIPGVQDTWNELLYTKLFFP